MTVTPSRIARTAAAAYWGVPDSQHKVNPGAFWFTTPGHGGIVGVVTELDLPAEVLAIARKHGLIDQVVLYRGSRGRTYSAVKQGCADADWTAYLARIGTRLIGAYDVWIGEEDCEYATLFSASDRVREADSAQRAKSAPAYPDSFGRRENFDEVCDRWYPAFLADLLAVRDALVTA